METTALSGICVSVCAVLCTFLVIWLLIQHLKDKKEVIRQVHLKTGLPDGWYEVIRHINHEWAEVICMSNNNGRQGQMFVVYHQGQLSKERNCPGSSFYAGIDDTGTTNVLGERTRGTTAPS